ncbi:MAG: SUF system Fe-S cluster assembly regulator [Myxococcota bacterium]
MIRLSKLADYGILILAQLARVRAEADPDAPLSAAASCNARELTQQVEIPLPMASKVLKGLTRAGVLESQRGAHGGYALASPPEELTVAEIIGALEGPLALTECSAGPAICDLEAHCAVRSPLLLINHVVENALASITLADLTNPHFAAQLSLLGNLARLPQDEARTSPLEHSYPNESLAAPSVEES